MLPFTEPADAPATIQGRGDLEAEQKVVDAAYEHLARMRAKAERLLAEMTGVDPDLDWALARRVKALSAPRRALCFGRTDATGGTTWYIGRRHVEDATGEPLVIEWRAPVALPFYRFGYTDADRVKGDGRMAEVLARALALRTRHDDADLEVILGLRRLVVPADAANAAAGTAASRRIPYAAARDLLRDLLVRLLYDRYVSWR